MGSSGAGVTSSATSCCSLVRSLASPFRRKTRRAKADASQQVEQQTQQAQQATAEQIENFKKAFSVCLEAKK